ncbi:MAG: PAS domain-containing protein [Bacteroidia bacterium]|nr:PAS domain-containing protein [Bacteroidia bacterium]
MDFHKLLFRQYKKYNLSENNTPPDFISEVNKTYNSFEERIRLLENILEVNQKELLRTNSELKRVLLEQELEIDRNIHEIRTSRNNLEESKTQLLAVFSAIDSVVISTNESGIIKFVSPSIKKQFGLEIHQVVGLDITSLARRIGLAINPFETLKNDQSLEFTSESGEKHFQLRLNTDNPESKNLVYSIMDITSDKNLRLQVEGQKEFYESILENIPADVALFTKDHRYIYLNSKAVKNPELRQLIIGKTDFEYFQATNRSVEKAIEREAIFQEAIQKRSYVEFDDRLVDANGKQKTLKRRFTPFLKPEYQEDYVMGFGIDVTELYEIQAHLKENEQKIKELNNSLEQKVIERTRELQIANKEMESFSYSVSHDLKSPLRAIQGYANILNEEYKQFIDTEGHRFLEEVIKNADRMTHLIDSLLSFSRLGKKEVHKVIFSLDELVSSMVEEEKPFPNPNSVLQIEPLGNAYADPDLLRQVLTNLISNALKYSSKKEKPTVEIKSIANGDELEVIVKDNGAGFNMDYYDKLFGVFQRLHSDKEFQGTGVGLALTQKIITKHGGRIWATSEPGNGAVFHFTLPQKQQQ